jgi:hypothetical protein
MFNFVRAQEDFFIPVHPTSSLRIDVTLFPPLRLHVDWGLERYGYPWVPTDQGPDVPVKWTQPARSPADLQVGPETLSTTPTTLDDLSQIPGDLLGLWRKLLPRSRCGAANRSEDREILSVITEGSLPNL